MDFHHYAAHESRWREPIRKIFQRCLLSQPLPEELKSIFREMMEEEKNKLPDQYPVFYDIQM